MVFEDRVSAYPNTYAMTDENGNVSRVILERADEPVIPGTPLNAETFNKMYEEIKGGAAPAGYGLGGYGENITISDIADLDNIDANGWYSIDIPGYVMETADFGGINVYMATMRVDAKNGNVCRQTLYPYGEAQTSIVRYKFIGVDQNAKWSPWYVENPPMDLGVVYRTTERCDRAVVYSVRVNVGALPNAIGEHKALGITNAQYGASCKIVDIKLEITDSIAKKQYINPYYIEDWGTLVYNIYNNGVQYWLRVSPNFNGSMLTGVVTVKFTK